MATTKPILFSGSMVLAMLVGRKVMTRRVLTPTHIRFFDGQGKSWRPCSEQLALALTDVSNMRCVDGDVWTWLGKAHSYQFGEQTRWLAHAAYSAGDVLWVREAISASGALVQYDADRETTKLPWPTDWKRSFAPPMHMLRRFSRLTLEVTNVAIQPLHEISENDAWAEGVTAFAESIDRPGSWARLTEEERRGIVVATYGSAFQAFRHLWESINGADSWSANPWVIAPTFKVQHQNVDAFVRAREAA